MLNLRTIVVLDNLTFIGYVYTFPYLRYTTKTSGFDINLM